MLLLTTFLTGGRVCVQKTIEIYLIFKYLLKKKNLTFTDISSIQWQMVYFWSLFSLTLWTAGASLYIAKWLSQHVRLNTFVLIAFTSLRLNILLA